MNTIGTIYTYQQGSTPDFRVSDQSKWYVLRERVQTNGLRIDVSIARVVSSEAEALAAIKELKAAASAAATLGRIGGAVTSKRKAASSAANGRKGGRPRKAA